MTTYNRRGLLILAAAGTAGVLAVPRLLTKPANVTNPANPPNPPNARAAAQVVPDLLSDDTFPIGFFWPPPPAETTTARYEEIRAAGFTFTPGGNDVIDMPVNDRMLRAAEAAGLRALAVDTRISNAQPCPGWEDTILRTLQEYQAYPAFAGFRVADEPSPVHYPRYRMILDLLKGRAPRLLSHINLVPVYDPARDAAYREHLARYVQQVDPTFVSFDHYPLLEPVPGDDHPLRATYFLNHRRVREAGLAAGLPTWVYIQVNEHWNLKQVTREELAWQITMSLAYGCKGIQYFTYWTPVDRPDFEFGDALIDRNGGRTALYHAAADLNTTYLQPVGRQLKHLVSESVVHANESPLPLGAIGFAASDRLRAVSGAPVVLGQFRRPGTDPRRWLLVANRAFTGAAVEAALTIQPAVTQVSEFDPATGAYTPVSLSPTPDGRRFTTRLPAGRGRLYLLDSAQPQPGAHLGAA